MPRIATRHAHKLAYRQRFSLGVRMLGCLVLLAGAIVLAAVVAELVKGSISKTVWFAVSLGCLLVACGGALFAGARGKLIDREARTVTFWWGIVWPLAGTSYDLQPYQAVGVEAYDDAGLMRWRVSLWNAQSDRLQLFDLASHEVAEAAARQVAGFLSLIIAAPPPCATATSAESVPAAPAEGAAAAPTETAPAQQHDDHWTYWQRFSAPVRLLGISLLSVGGVLFVGMALSAAAGSDSLRWLAAAAPASILGCWLLCGGRKIAVDPAAQAVRLWRAWPLPPAVYDLAAFSAVIVAPLPTEPAEQSFEYYLVGLIGPDRLRLELIAPLPCDQASAAAGNLAAIAKLPLIDESQTAAAPPQP